MRAYPFTTLAGTSMSELLASSRPPTQELTVHIQDIERIFEFSAALVSHSEPVVEWVIVLRDVTQNRQRIDRAKKQARLAAVGQLSAGIAHDFNNILSVIIGVSDLNLSREPDDLPDDLQGRPRSVFWSRASAPQPWCDMYSTSAEKNTKPKIRLSNSMPLSRTYPSFSRGRYPHRFRSHLSHASQTPGFSLTLRNCSRLLRILS